MRTLLITNDYPPVVSGISTVFFRVWKRLDYSTHWVLTPKIPGGREFDRESGAKVIRHPVVPGEGKVAKVVNTLIQFAYAKSLVLFRNVRKLHAGQIWTSGTICWILKKFIGIPYFLWVYGGEPREVYMKGNFSTFWADTLLKGSVKIITNSRFSQKEFLDYGFSPERCPIILPAVDPDIFTPGEPLENLREKWGLYGKKTLLTVARISARKGHDLVLRALPRIMKIHPDVIYLIVGKGDDRSRLEKLADELGIKDKVAFCGFVPDRELPDYYRLCDVYVMPNREIFHSTDSIEGFGISFVEASSCEKPVIGGRSGGAVEAVEDGVSGWLVDPDNTDELADKVIEILSDEQLRTRIGRQGRQRVLEKMTWEGRAIKLMELEG